VNGSSVENPLNGHGIRSRYCCYLLSQSLMHMCQRIVGWHSMTVTTVKCGQRYTELKQRIVAIVRLDGVVSACIALQCYKDLRALSYDSPWQWNAGETPQSPSLQWTFNTISGQQHCRHCHRALKCWPATPHYEAVDFYHCTGQCWCMFATELSDDSPWQFRRWNVGEGTWKWSEELSSFSLQAWLG
jgi:hypothetical protein